MTSDCAIGESKFFQRVICLMRDPLAEVDGTKAFDERVNQLLNDSVGYRYAYYVFHKLGEVNDAYNFMQYSSELLSGYRSRSKTSRAKVPRSEYIRYHIESHMVNAFGLYDRCLLLVNTVFQLGNAEECCTDQTVLRNGYVVGSPVVACMKRLKKLLRGHRDNRNAVVHRRRYGDDTLNDLAVLTFMPLSGELAKYRHLVKTKCDNYLKERRQQMERFNKELLNVLVPLCDSLLREFEWRLVASQGS